MKMLLSISLLALSLFGSAAHAYEGVMMMNEYGQVTLQPLHHHCDGDETPQPAVVESQADLMGYCHPSDNKGCPKGYQSMAKYCWGGWHHGFYRCGSVCRPVPDCQHGGGDDMTCPGRGHH